jgi:hypothetical protein
MNVRRSAALVSLALATTACSGTQRASPPPVAPSEANAVIADWYVDGIFNKPHRCAAVRVAIERLPTSLVYSTLVDDTRALEHRTCA